MFLTRIAVMVLSAALLSLEVYAANLDDSVKFTTSRFRQDTSTGIWEQLVTIKNISKHTIVGPLELHISRGDGPRFSINNIVGGFADDATAEIPLSRTGTLARKKAARLRVQFSTENGSMPVVNYSIFGELLQAENSATLSVRGFDTSNGETPDEALPIKAGFLAAIDGYARGVTNAKGEVRVQVPITASTVSLSRPPNTRGTATLPDLQPGEEREVNVYLTDGGEFTENATLRLDGVIGGVLPDSVDKVSCRFLRGSNTVKLRSLQAAEIRSPAGGAPIDVLSEFKIQKGGSIVAPAGNVLSRIGSGGRILYLLADDAAGRLYDGEITVQVGRHTVQGELLPSLSDPTLPVNGVVVRAELLNSTIAFSAITDSQGRFTFKSVPDGSLSFSASVDKDGTTYSGEGEATLNSSAAVAIRMRTAEEVLDGVPGITVTPLDAEATAAQKDEAHVRLERLRLSRLPQSSAQADELARFSTRADEATISATAAAQNTPITSTIAVDIPAGTSSITLEYVVTTAEYPTYVLQQSVYNDRWSVNLKSPSGGNLFQITRQVNSQLTADPAWLSTGSTGPVAQTIDVSALTNGVAASLVLVVSATNIGDSILPTTVVATARAATLTIDKVTRLPPSLPTVNSGNIFSIPATGAANSLQRYFQLDVSRPPGATLESLQVHVDGSSGELMNILNLPVPSGSDVQILETKPRSFKLKVRGTVLTPLSTVNGIPPPTRDLVYRFKLSGRSAEGDTLIADRLSAGSRSLWHMPAGLPRYGRPADVGDDDWVARGAYNWIQANSALLEGINDVSGEHGRNIGHLSHQYGTDIDMYHFYTFAGANANSGTSNYNVLIENVVAAFGTLATNPTPESVTAKAAVEAWVLATREGLRALTNKAEVARIYYAIGDAASGLTAGWASSLIRNGTAKKGNKTLDLELEEWSDAKVSYNSVHNNHVHVTLDRTRIGE